MKHEHVLRLFLFEVNRAEWAQLEKIKQSTSKPGWIHNRKKFSWILIRLLSVNGKNIKLEKKGLKTQKTETNNKCNWRHEWGQFVCSVIRFFSVLFNFLVIRIFLYGGSLEIHKFFGQENYNGFLGLTWSWRPKKNCIKTFLKLKSGKLWFILDFWEIKRLTCEMVTFKKGGPRMFWSSKFSIIHKNSISDKDFDFLQKIRFWAEISFFC